MSGLSNGRLAAVVSACFVMLCSGVAVAQEAPGRHAADAVSEAVEAAIGAADHTEEPADDDEAPATDEPQSPEASELSEVSEDERAALEAALAADAGARDEGEHEPASGSVSGEDASVESSIAATPTSMASSTVSYDLAFILDVAGAWFSDEEPLQIGAHDPSVTGFNFQQLEMSVGASVDPYLRFDSNIVFSLFGVEVEEAYATTLGLPLSLQMRAGQFLTPFGRLNDTHPHAWRFLDQPLANGKFFGSEGSRGLGVELSWLTPLPWYVELVGAANSADGACCARSFYGADNPGVRGPSDLLYTTRIEQFFGLGDALSLLWGMSAQFGPNSTGLDNRTEIYGTDLYLRYRPPGAATRSALSLQIEAMFRTRQVPNDALRDVGGYAELAWNINPRWETGVRYEPVTGLDDDPLDPEWTGERQRTSIQGTFYPSHFSRLRLQLAHDDPSWREEPIYAAMLGLEVLVGAHGSHEF